MSTTLGVCRNRVQCSGVVPPPQVLIDAHILCTPSIGDIDADGHDELVVAASYFFDREYYDDPVRLPAPDLYT